jgi:glycine dehydrogenase
MTDFAVRHIGPAPAEQEHMLGRLGFSSLDELTTAALPAGTPPAGLQLPDPLTETEALAELRRMAGRNQVLTSMIGLGYYDTITPAVIRRNVLENPAWYTAYTPYQPEISQGRLEALLNFQTMVADLTGLPWAGASLLDEATAAVEAMTLARRAAKKGHVFLADADCLPQTLAVLRTRAEPLGIHLVVEPVTPEAIARLGDDLFGVLLQFPGASGVIRDPAPLIEAAHAAGALAAVAADLLSLTLLRPPGEAGADVAVGSTQRLGVPLWFGGPHAGYIAVSDALKRQLPGRLVGVSVDADGRPAYRLALQAREQHIRREKATSNICTAQVLLAVTAAMYAAYHGPDGLAAIARGVHRSAAVLAATLRGYGHRTSLGDFFDTIRIVFAGGRDEAAHALERARVAGYNLYLAPDDALQVSCDETTTDDQLRALVAALCFVEDPADVELSEPDGALPGALRRTSAYLTHPVFSEYRSETAMLRYLRRLADFDIALDRSMIPLGSCTMKLNAAAEMEPISWPGFAGMHPFAPASQAGGYLELIESQPNAGSQGELAGLLAIRGYHASQGLQERDVCLIPESAHGTNAASAVLAGLRVAVVKCDADGAVGLGDLQAKLEAHEGHVAAIMITYPSTAGVYEQNVSEICAAVHAAGGQVYIDGANLNALVGVANLPAFGADVSHLNLHKTFCIPHGGGGPGVGPVAVRAHLADFLPGRGNAGPVAAAPYGSAGILPISWAYVAMMGAAGLKQATQVAVLSANYVAKRLAPHYPVLYTGRNGLVAHECVIDLRPLARDTGITVDDVAKRLIDYGFHAPTMSFPVAGTLMIEPTESENLAEIDRFCDALIAIRAEIARVISGEYDAHDNPLKNAPHTAEMLIAGEWKHPYDAEQAAYPAGVDRRAKYWPPVRRVDQAYGDRNLVCACPPPEAFAG